MVYVVKCETHGRGEVRASMKDVDSLTCPVCEGPVRVVPCARTVVIPRRWRDPIRESEVVESTVI
jgi:hypothetical protein